jgi:predicted urease superfamily metal-dependent hydrolase
MSLKPIIDRWRNQDAPMLRLRGAVEAAATTEALANELERLAEQHTKEVLTFDQAADESGYSADHIARLVAEGRLQNVGERGAPRVLRGQLPKKPPPKPASRERPDLLARTGRSAG